MEREVNKRFIQLYGKLEIGKDYELGQDLNPTVTITHSYDKDNQDGTVDRTYKARLFNND